MNYQPQVNNQAKKLKVNQPTNYLIPPYNRPSKEELQRWRESQQLSIIPALQPKPKDLLQPQQVQKEKQVVKSKPKSNQSTKHKIGFTTTIYTYLQTFSKEVKTRTQETKGGNFGLVE